MHRLSKTLVVVLVLLGANRSRAAEATPVPAPTIQTNPPPRPAGGDDSLRTGLRLDASKDFAGAFVHFQKAAEQGNAEGAFRAATYRLGGRQASAEGPPVVAEDPPEAVKLLERAALLGHVEAMRVLGACLTRGRGVSRDKIEAFKWWRIAATRGDGTAKAYLELTAEEISPQDVAEAERRAAELSPKIDPPSAAARPDGKPEPVRLRLNGISGPDSRRVALINNQAFSVGEQKKLSFPGTNFVLRCVEITTTTVRVQANDSEEVVTLGFAAQ